MTDRSDLADQIRSLRVSRGLSQSDVAAALDISLRTVVRIEKEGRGHNLRRVQRFLEDLSTGARDLAGSQAIRTFIKEESRPGGEPLAAAFHELAALLSRLPYEHRATAMQTFIDVQRKLDDGATNPLRTLEAAAQVTVRAFSQFVRDGQSR